MQIPHRLVGAMVTSSDSKEIIDEESGVDLLGNGDMIFKDVKSGEKIRVQAPFISTDEQGFVLRNVSKINEYKDIELKEIVEEIDPLFEDAKRLVIENQKASASFLQREFVISYNRAARLMEQLEKEGIIGPQIGAQGREILADENVLKDIR